MSSAQQHTVAMYVSYAYSVHSIVANTSCHSNGK